MKHPGTSLKPSRNPLETALKLLWSLLQTPLKTLQKHPRNCLVSLLKCSQHTPETSLNTHQKLFLQHTWHFLKTPWKLQINNSKTSFNHSQNLFEIPLKLTENSLTTPLKGSWNILWCKAILLDLHTGCPAKKFWVFWGKLQVKFWHIWLYQWTEGTIPSTSWSKVRHLSWKKKMILNPESCRFLDQLHPLVYFFVHLFLRHVN